VTVPGSIGRYTVTSEIGRGAMGVVYRGMDPALERPVAIKVIAARAGVAQLSGPELDARFLREARVAARISHPGVVTVYDAGREGDLLYLVMELVEGEALGERLARRDFPGAAEALELVAQVADALSAAHALGVVHRDIKPANIILTRGGKMKVADFGVAKAMGEDTDLTRSGTVIGSPAYMAPEQVRGEALDGRADLFSLGVVLYELLLRRKPFPADTVTSLIYQILHEDPLADPQISRVLGCEAAAFLGRCLAKQREQRIPDARTLAAGARALAAEWAGEAAEGPATLKIPVAFQAPSPAAVASAPEGGLTRAPRRPRAWLVPVLAGLGVVAVIGGYLELRRMGDHRSGPVSEEPTPAVATAAPTPAPVRPTPKPRRPHPTPRPTLPREATPQMPALIPTAAPAAPQEPTVPSIVAIFYCRRAAEFKVSPREAGVMVDGNVLGQADGRKHVFDRPGKHLVQLSLRGYRTTWIQIVVDPAAVDEVVEVDTVLPQQ
jgi:hypothetical protein